MAVAQLSKVLSDDPRDDISVISTTDGAGETRRISVARDRALSNTEIDDIAAFLASLTADR